MAISTKLAELRRQKGASLQAVADAVGVSKPHIWELEKGHSKNPSADLVTRLAKYFAVPTEFLLDDQKEDVSEQEAAVVFYRDLKSLDEHDQKIIMENIRMLRERTNK